MSHVRVEALTHGKLKQYNFRISLLRSDALKSGGFRSFAGIYTVLLKGADKLLARVQHTKARKHFHINMCPETFNL
jgi:hypothetical protein